MTAAGARLVACAALWLVGCGPGRGQATTPAPVTPTPTPEEPVPAAAPPLDVRAPTAAESAAVQRLVRVTERTRGLSFARPVPVEVHGPAAITAHLTDDLDPDEIEIARQLYVALGLLDPELDVVAMLRAVLGEQVVGYYDPADGQLVVREDVMRELGRRRALGAMPSSEAPIVLVHELVHALQDQRLGLGEVHDLERDSDADHAFRGLVEGDATLAMLGYMGDRVGSSLEAVTQDPQRLRQMTASGGALPGDELNAAPAILRVTLVGAYMHGLVFCAELYRRGGWPLVNAIYRRMPTSSEQVMHPERYLRGELPETVAIPPLPALEAAGLTELDEDTLGEIELGVYFGQTHDGVDEPAADGWGGDRLRAYRDSAGRVAAVWFTTWDSEAEAREAERAARAIRDRLTEAERSRHHLERNGRALLIVHGLDPALAPPVQAAFSAMAAALPPAPPRAP